MTEITQELAVKENSIRPISPPKDFIDAEFTDVADEKVSPAILNGPKDVEVPDILKRADIAELLQNLSVNPRPVQEPKAQLRTQQALLARVLTGVNDSNAFSCLAGMPSPHIQDTLRAMTDAPSDETTREIRNRINTLDNPQSHGGRFSLAALLKAKPHHQFGDSALLAEEACSRYTLSNLIRRAEMGQDNSGGKDAVEQIKNLHSIHKRMGERGTETMRDGLSKSKNALKDIADRIENNDSLKEIHEAIAKLVEAIVAMFSRKSKATA